MVASLDLDNGTALLPEESAPPRARRRLTDMPRWFGGLVGIVIVVALWWLVAVTFFGSSGVVPTPVQVVRQAIDDGWSVYWTNASVTTLSALKGFLWGNAVAFVLAVIALLIPAVETVISQFGVVTYCIPVTAIGPIIFITSESGARTTSIFLAAMLCIYTTVIGCILGWRAADRTALDLVRAYGGSRWTQLRKVQLIAALPNILGALKIAAPTAFLGAVLGEYLGGLDNGMGVIITAAQTELRYAQIWVLIIISGIISGIGYALIGLLGKLVAPWQVDSAAVSSL